MSVVAGKRGESKLEVDTKAYDLLEYVVSICQSEKKFQKSDGINFSWLGNRMMSSATDILCYVRMANKLNRSDSDRERFQCMALTETEKMFCLGQVAYENQVLKSKQIKFYTKSIQEVKDLILRWRKSDREINKDDK